MTYSEKTTTKRITKQEKELLQNKTNQESLAAESVHLKTLVLIIVEVIELQKAGYMNYFFC